jgi:hypothetical protein
MAPTTVLPATARGTRDASKNEGSVSTRRKSDSVPDSGENVGSGVRRRSVGRRALLIIQ